MAKTTAVYEHLYGIILATSRRMLLTRHLVLAAAVRDTISARCACVCALSSKGKYKAFMSINFLWQPRQQRVMCWAFVLSTLSNSSYLSPLWSYPPYLAGTLEHARSLNNTGIHIRSGYPSEYWSTRYYLLYSGRT